MILDNWNVHGVKHHSCVCYVCRANWRDPLTGYNTKPTKSEMITTVQADPKWLFDNGRYFCWCCFEVAEQIKEIETNLLFDKPAYSFGYLSANRLAT